MHHRHKISLTLCTLFINYFFTPVLNSQGMKKLRYAIQKVLLLLLLLLGLQCFDAVGWAAGRASNL